MKTITGIHGGRYYVVDEENEVSYPSVTTVLSATGDKSGLEDWKKRIGEREAQRISEYSANRGTFMHTLHEFMLDEVFVHGKDMGPSYKVALEKAREELKDRNFTEEEEDCGLKLFTQFTGTEFYKNISEVLFQEEAVWTPFSGGYAGRLDLMIKDKYGNIKLIDFKSSRKPKQENWIKDYFLQGSAYSIGSKYVFDVLPSSAEIWISCESGEVQTFSIDRSDMRKYIREFLDRVEQYHKMIKAKDVNT